MIKTLDTFLKEYDFLNKKLLSLPLTSQQFLTTKKKIRSITPIITTYLQIKTLIQEKQENQRFLKDNDNEIKHIAKEELENLKNKTDALKKKLKTLLIPKNVNDKKNVILEIRAGTGGHEACLFAGKLFHMYIKLAEHQKWKFNIINKSEGVIGGFKDIAINITGKDVFSWLKYEAGVHRVQRIPETESQGRIHTSVCSIAVLVEAKEIDIKIKDKDIRIDAFRSSGPGGQSVNTTDSAIRIMHLKTGIIVQCQNEKSQIKNKNKALKVLRARLYDLKQRKLNKERSNTRKKMVKSGDRSDKIRTYNFIQDRCTDHRTSITMYKLSRIFLGNIKNLIIKIKHYFQQKDLEILDLNNAVKEIRTLKD